MWISYDNTYEVSENGEVRNKHTQYIKQPSLSKDGYLVLFLANVRKGKSVARMVGERFLPLINNPGLEIDHIDRNRTNNSASNLRWVSHSENCQNKGMYENNKTGHKYICRRNKDSYRVQIKHYSTLAFNKTYKTLEEAIRERDRFISSLRQ